MKLTGKCKEDFEKWYFKNHCKSTIKFKQLLPHNYEDIFGWFFGLNLSFQYGIYVDFFDSVDLSINITIYKEGKWYDVDINDEWVGNGHAKTRQEAREQAILKANEIYNSKTEK